MHARNISYSHIEEQNEERTEQLGRKVKSLKHIALKINGQLEEDIVELSKHRPLFDSAYDRMLRARERLKVLPGAAGWKIYLYLFVFSLFVFFIIYFLRR